MKKTVAVIGASSDRRKFGNKGTRAFVAAGWEVYPINPNEPEVEGLKTYPSVKDVPVDLDRVTMYVGPRVGKKLINEIAEKGAKEVVYNPGSADRELVEMTRALGLKAVETCSIIDIGMRPSMFGDT